MLNTYPFVVSLKSVPSVPRHGRGQSNFEVAASAERYNRVVRTLLATVVAIAALTTSSCSKDIQNSDAVKQGVIDYLRAKNGQTGLNMDAMTVDVTSVSYEKDAARATLRFTPKGIPGGGMQMTYVLDRKGNK